MVSMGELGAITTENKYEITQTGVAIKKKDRILVVDDEPDVCMLYQLVLEDAGLESIPYTDSVKDLQEFDLTIMIWFYLISKCLY
jgi:hypothetical protein